MILTALDAVSPGMVLGAGLRNKEGHVLLGPGVALTADYLARLHDLGYCAIWIDDEDTRDIPHEEALSESTRTVATAVIKDTFAMTAKETQNLRSASAAEIRGALESRRFHQAFHDTGLVERLTGQVETVVEEVLNRDVLVALGSVMTHSSYIYHHCLDVMVTATMIGRLLGHSRETLQKLAIGCVLHDVGSIFVDSVILDKPASLTEDEFCRVQNHTVLGYLFVRDTLRLGVLCAHVAYQHHERQDGGGYPRGLRGTNRIVQGSDVHFPGRITPLAEIAAVADFHDACSDARPYRERMAPDTVWETLRAAGGQHLNQEIVDGFLSVLPPYPPGTRVVVTSGTWKDHVGVVARVKPDAMRRPLIRLLWNASGERVPAIEIDLGKEDTEIRGTVSR